MARATLTKTTLKGQYGAYSADSADLTLAAANVADKNQFVFRPGDILLAQNSGAAPYTVTITSAASKKTNRTGDITTYSLAAGEIAVFGPFDDPDGWMQSDGYVYCEATNAAVKFAVIAKPA
jgi:hypothetical protein